MPRSCLRLALAACAVLAVPPGAAVAQGTGAGEAVREGGLAGAYVAGRAAVRAGDHREAAAYFARALEDDPGNLVLIGSAVFANAALGRWDAAVAVSAGVPDAAVPGQDLVHLVRLVAQVRAGDLGGALAAIEAGRGAGQFVDPLARAWLMLGAGDMSSAEAALRELTRDRALGQLAWLHLAYAKAAVGDFEGAEAILAGPDVGGLGRTPRVLRARAEILVQLGDRGAALDLLDGFTRRVPDPGLLALQARIGSGAEGPYGFITTAAQGLGEVFFTVAQAMGTETGTNLPLIYARAAYGVAPENAAALLLVGALLLESGDYALAAEAVAQVPEGDDHFVEAQLARAEALEEAGETEAAIAALQALALARPDLPSVHAALGDALRRAERFAEAIVAYTETLDRVDTDLERYWFVYYARAISHHRSDDWPPAEADFRRALELSPDQPNVLNYLGYSLVEQRRSLDEALGMIERAAAARPDSGYIVDSLGWVYYRLGRFADAVDPMERAVELLPTDPIINDHLGDVYWMVGRQREARFQWERALSFGPEPEDAARIRLKLEIGLDRVLEQEGGVGETQ